eukprot:365377-Chlamydomonas_euryale.AAC.2
MCTSRGTTLLLPFPCAHTHHSRNHPTLALSPRTHAPLAEASDIWLDDADARLRRRGRLDHAEHQVYLRGDALRLELLCRLDALPRLRDAAQRSGTGSAQRRVHGYGHTVTSAR